MTKDEQDRTPVRGVHPRTEGTVQARLSASASPHPLMAFTWILSRVG